MSFSDKATTMIKRATPLLSDVYMVMPTRHWQMPASSLATTFHAPSSLPWPTAPSLLCHLPHPPSEVLLVEEAHHRVPTTAVRLHPKEVNSLETEPLANNVFPTASGDEAKEFPNMLAQVEVAVVNVSEAGQGTDLTEPCYKTPMHTYPHHRPWHQTWSLAYSA